MNATRWRASPTRTAADTLLDIQGGCSAATMAYDRLATTLLAPGGLTLPEDRALVVETGDRLITAREFQRRLQGVLERRLAAIEGRHAHRAATIATLKAA